MTTWTPRQHELRQHPQLAPLAGLAHQLELASAALAARYGQGARNTDPALHQARSIAHTARVLRHQIDAYRKLLDGPAPPSKTT